MKKTDINRSNEFLEEKFFTCVDIDLIIEKMKRQKPSAYPFHWYGSPPDTKLMINLKMEEICVSDTNIYNVQQIKISFALVGRGLTDLPVPVIGRRRICLYVIEQNWTKLRLRGIQFYLAILFELSDNLT